ncbi:hypothetical protein [Paraflavitalea sp. CAU 1676]|uniref:hypothetical protein n=1 Tax=Paraflavitalea sp. CAU 1676 TaxID=3032598 RepID=UPI0023D9B24C|nr:hypothetical protein [Paraflavitalea sp. CAU 1676]MDF2190187.1 hypothetical protein [Paraflavitalea sp. CAU 1676]
MKPLLFFAVLLYSSVGVAQQTSDIQFDRTGKITSSLPERFGKEDKVIFRMSDSKESFENYLKNYKDRLRQAISTLTTLKDDKQKMKLLEVVYDIKGSDIDLVIAELKTLVDAPVGNDVVYMPRFKEADKNYIGFTLGNTAVAGAEVVAPNANTAPMAVKPFGPDAQINFSVTKKDPFKKLVMGWLQSTKDSYGGAIDLGPVQQVVAAIEKTAAEVGAFAGKVRPDIARFTEESVSGDENALIKKYTPLFNEILQQTGKFQGQVDALNKKLITTVALHDKKNWMLKWLWYQRNQLPALNPLGFSESIGAAPDTSMLEGIRTRLQVRETFLKSNLDKLKPAQIDSVLNVIDADKKKINEVQKAVKKFAENSSLNSKAATSFSTVSTDLYNGILYVEDKSNIYYWMRHHNAAANYQLMNTLETDEFLETDKVVILAHNLTPNERASLNLSFAAITNDASLLTDQLLPVIATLGSAILKTGGPGMVTLKQKAAEADKGLRRLVASLEELQDNTRYLDYLLQQSNPPLDIEERTEKSMAYHSEVTNPVKKEKGPRKATYYLNTVVLNAQGGDSVKLDKVPTDTFSYRINKLYRLFPMAGIAWVPQRLASVSQDSTGKFSINEEAAVKFVVGLKVYLRKTDIRSPKFITARGRDGEPLIWSRTSLTLAFDIKKPLDNIYTGVGLDLWPGFCVNFGGMFNKYNFKSYKNGQVFKENKQYRGAFYMGVSTDLTLFAELSKFLGF